MAAAPTKSAENKISQIRSEKEPKDTDISRKNGPLILLAQKKWNRKEAKGFHFILFYSGGKTD